MFGAFRKPLTHVWIWSPLVVAGCSDQHLDPQSVSQIGAISTNNDDAKTIASRYAASHDFGFILTPSPELRHDFRLLNSSKKTLVFRQAVAEKSCCSRFISVPKSVAPGQEALIPVAFKPNTQLGIQAVRFFLETNDPENPVRTFEVQATLASEFEVYALNPVKRLGLGESGQVRLNVSRFQVSKESGAEKVSKLVKANGKDFASLRIIEGSKTEQFGKLHKIEQNVEACLPPSSKKGMKSAELSLSWDDGKSSSHYFHWEVVESIRATPEGFVLKRDDRRQQHVVLTSDDKPFRIIKIVGPARSFDEKMVFPSSSGKNHHLELTILAETIASHEVARITVHTDHPLQPEVVLTVMALENPKEATQ